MSSSTTTSGARQGLDATSCSACGVTPQWIFVSKSARFMKHWNGKLTHFCGEVCYDLYGEKSAVIRDWNNFHGDVSGRQKSPTQTEPQYTESMKFKMTESKKSAIWSLVYRVAVNHTMEREEFFDRMEKYLACDDSGEPLVIEREDGTPFQVECVECEGRGSLEVDTGDGRSDNELITGECETCMGLGVVEFEQNVRSSAADEGGRSATNC